MDLIIGLVVVYVLLHIILFFLEDSYEVDKISRGVSKGMGGFDFDDLTPSDTHIHTTNNFYDNRSVNYGSSDKGLSKK